MAPRPTTQPAAFAEERQARILQLVNERGSIRNTELAHLLGVTEPTIRRDVTDLASQRRLRRAHGGVLALHPPRESEPDLPVRVARNESAKTRVARACLALVGPGDAVFLDSGSTVLRIAQLLGEGNSGPQPIKNVNVLTNAVAVAQALTGCSDVRHTLLGGSYRAAGGSLVGPLTLAALDDFTVNIAFMGVTGLTPSGLFVADLAEAQVKRAVIGRAHRIVVAMDTTKLGASDFVRMCSLTEVSTVVTDALSDDLERLCADAHVELVVAEADDATAELG
jgi:DeoR/GlpR family transcriptional regulator of sugar metabolism